MTDKRSKSRDPFGRVIRRRLRSCKDKSRQNYVQALSVYLFDLHI